MPGKIDDILRNHVKDKLARGEVVSSMTVRLVRGMEIARVAHIAGFDSLYADMERADFRPAAAGRWCQSAIAKASPLWCGYPAWPRFRVCSTAVRSASSPRMSAPPPRRREYVRAAKFPPLGDRSAAGPLPHLHYRSFPAAEADAALNAATLLMVQFENEQTMARADEIAAVEGVDMVMIGSNDLLADGGLAGRYEHARLREAYAGTIAACRKHGKQSASAGYRRGRARRRIRRMARATSLPAPISDFAGGRHRESEGMREIKLNGQN